MANAAAAARIALDAEISDLDLFKRQSAILHNSKSFFPVAARNLAERFPAETPLAIATNALLRDVLAYEQTGGEALARRVKDDEDVLRALSGEADVQANVVNVLIHADTILSYKPGTDKAVARGVGHERCPDYASIRRALIVARAAEERDVGLWRAGLYAVCLVLIGAVAHTWWSLHASQHELRSANASLESREQTGAFSVGEERV